MTASRGEALLWRQVRVPEQMLGDGPAGPCGGDLRIGDLDGDGRVEFVVYRNLAGLKPAFIGAFDLNGDPLWSFGDPGREVTVIEEDGEERRGLEPPERPGPVAVADIDGDGRTEVLALVLADELTRTHHWRMDGVELVVLDGATGEVKQREACEKLQAADGYVDGELLPPNYVHQRLMLCDLRGRGRSGDFVVKVGQRVFAFGAGLEVLWTYDCPWNRYPHHCAYIPAVGDLDGDGRDEVNLGNTVLDEDGTPLWERFQARHNDSVLIEEWDGRLRAIISGYGQVLDERGQPLIRLGPELVPHGQEIRCGDLREDRDGPEMVIRYDGHTPKLMVVGRGGEILDRFGVPGSPNNTGLEVVRWEGPNQPEVIYTPAALVDGHGGLISHLPELPEPSGGNQGWYHCFPADLCGDEREELVLYDPLAASVFIYTPQPLNEAAYRGYAHGPRQYNARLMD
ncbi:MAG: hypothetical protein U9R79_04415 [Armatimonadota bacterium]|nr:hypothetical protein [Armatimonadota bacterium]